MTPVTAHPHHPPARAEWYWLAGPWLLSMVTDSKTGKPNLKKIGEVAVGVTWTAYMWSRFDDPVGISVEMWAAYAGVLLTWSTVNYGMKRKADSAEAAAEALK